MEPDLELTPDQMDVLAHYVSGGKFKNSTRSKSHLDLVKKKFSASAWKEVQAERVANGGRIHHSRAIVSFALMLILTGCASRPRPHVTWPTEELDYGARWKCEAQDPHNTGKDCTKRAFHFRVKR